MNKNHIAPMRDHAQKRLKGSATLRLLFEEERAKTEIARMIRAAREKAGLSQRELAQKAGTTQAVVARLEIGSDQRMPSLGLIARLLHAAGGKLEIVCRFDKVA